MEEFIARKWSSAFLFSCFLLFSQARSMEKIRAANLGGWLVLEGWMAPSLFDGIPNRELLDGTRIQFKSVSLQKFIAAENGGGSSVSVNRDTPSSWETFRLWRVSETDFQFLTDNNHFLTCDGEGCTISAISESPTTFTIIRQTANGNGNVHIKLPNGPYLQASSSNQLTADYLGEPGWDDNMATFEMLFAPDNKLEGEFQLTNGYGPDKAKEVLTAHRSNFITADDFKFMSQNGINTVRIPVGWWIAQDPNPPLPFVGGSLQALDNAFRWANENGIKCIIDLHAARGSQNEFEHSASRDHTSSWSNSPEFISETLRVIEFLAQRYAPDQALLGIELLNEPDAKNVPFEVLRKYYSDGYNIVRKYSSTAYVIICQRIGNADPNEFFQANIGPSRVVVDIHYYSLFDSKFDRMSVQDNIDFIHGTRQPEVLRYSNSNGPLVFIGEWVNEMAIRNATASDYQRFGKAQLDVYNAASFGWAYWSIKLDQRNSLWDLKWQINNKLLVLGDSPSN